MAETQVGRRARMRGTHQEVSGGAAGGDTRSGAGARGCGALVQSPDRRGVESASAGAGSAAAFHLRHMARSMDRLLSYAEGEQLSPEQLEAMKGEADPRAKGEELLAEFEAALRAQRAAHSSAGEGRYGNGTGAWDARRCRPAWADCWSMWPTTPAATWASW